MSDLVARPTFYEGEILPAGDLVATVDYGRDQMARHERYLHRYGIAAGLGLTSQSVSGASSPYVTVTLSAGVAVDGTGREIVVPADVQLNSTDFLGDVSPETDTTVWYPVFLTGIDQSAFTSSNLTGACNTALPTRQQEAYEVHYGARGTELNLDQQQTVGFEDGPGDGITTDPWKVLLGFVQYDQSIGNGQFTAAADTNPDGIGRRYVGVNACQVFTESGAVRMATHPPGSGAPGPVMALEIHESSKGELIFGKQHNDGSLTPVLTVSASGDLTVTGKVTGAVTPGSMQVQSGIAFDGVVLPLPVGIDPSAVSAGKVTLFTHVSFRYERLQPPSGPGPWMPIPLECSVDSVTRQIHCRVQWLEFSANLVVGPILPCFCDYTVIAAVAASGSGP